MHITLPNHSFFKHFPSPSGNPSPKSKSKTGSKSNSKHALDAVRPRDLDNNPFLAGGRPKISDPYSATKRTTMAPFLPPSPPSIRRRSSGFTVSSTTSSTGTADTMHSLRSASSRSSLSSVDDKDHGSSEVDESESEIEIGLLSEVPRLGKQMEVTTEVDADIERGRGRTRERVEQYDLRERAIRILKEGIYGHSDDNPDIIDTAQPPLSDLLSDEIRLQIPSLHPHQIPNEAEAEDNDDETLHPKSKPQVLEIWSQLQHQRQPQHPSTTTTTTTLQIHDALLDSSQRKVWIYSEVLINTEDKKEEAQQEEKENTMTMTTTIKERTDMLTFNGEGKLREVSGWYRRRSRRGLGE